MHKKYKNPPGRLPCTQLLARHLTVTLLGLLLSTFMLPRGYTLLISISLNTVL